MKYIKLFESFTHKYFPEILECITNTYDDDINWLIEDLDFDEFDQWADFIDGCLNDDDKKDFGKLFYNDYIAGDKLPELVNYLKEELNKFYKTDINYKY